MPLPFSDAETTFMPEMHPQTEPMAAVKAREHCAWCGIKLTAIPDTPRPVHAPNGKIVHTHPGGCTAAFREVVAWKPEEVSSAEPGPSEPR